MRKSLLAAEEEGKRHGLMFNAEKCLAISIVPKGKEKKFKVVTDQQFHLADGTPIKQLKPSERFKYLGVEFSPSGVIKCARRLELELGNISAAPLKPQQRLKLLRCFLIPRFYHQLVLSGCTMRTLRALDKQVRLAIRKWLLLPKDVPIGYFHTNCKDGGLGIPAFSTAIPDMMRRRLSAMEKSSLEAARQAYQLQLVQKRLNWATKVLSTQGCDGKKEGDPSKIWKERLYSSIDGNELKEAEKTPESSKWIDGGSYGIPGRDFVQYNHIRINTLPTLVRKSRGRRQDPESIKCRSKCNATETSAHVIQNCFRTHRGWVLRHNAVSQILCNELKQRGWFVKQEPHYKTASGLLKPDAVARRDEEVCVIDTQVVSGAYPLDAANQKKIPDMDSRED
jgi:hypothetical protein